jgi:ABC-type dipeptide/oligopeptide/nickel transport system ATPase component
MLDPANGIAVMKDGRVVEARPVAQVLEQPSTRPVGTRT